MLYIYILFLFFCFEFSSRKCRNGLYFQEQSVYGQNYKPFIVSTEINKKIFFCFSCKFCVVSTYYVDVRMRGFARLYTVYNWSRLDNVQYSSNKALIKQTFWSVIIQKCSWYFIIREKKKKCFHFSAQSFPDHVLDSSLYPFHECENETEKLTKIQCWKNERRKNAKLIANNRPKTRLRKKKHANVLGGTFWPVITY